MTFRSRLVLAAAIAVAAAVVLASLAAFFAARGALLNSVDQDLQQKAHSLVSAGSRIQLQTEINEVTALGMTMQTLATDGTIGSTTETQVLPDPASVQSVADGDSSGFFTTVNNLDGQQVREVVYPIQGGGALQLATPLADVNLQLNHLRLLLGGVVAVGIALAVSLGWLVAHTALIPLDDLTASVEDLAATTDMDRRLSPGGADELGRLRKAFNRLLEAVDSSRMAQRQLVLDASHELRTPLTSLRTNLEVARRLDELSSGEREVLVADVLAQLGELTTLVGDIEELAREGQRSVTAETFRLDHITEEATALATVHGRPRHVTFAQNLQPTWVHASRHRVARAIGNLLDNALKWSPDGASVEVSCIDGEVVVRDHGPGVAATDLPHIFDRFYRAAAARALPGSGLGLAIVAQVAKEEGGSVSAGNHPAGGAVVRLCLPTVQALPPEDDPDR